MLNHTWFNGTIGIFIMFVGVGPKKCNLLLFLTIHFKSNNPHFTIETLFKNFPTKSLSALYVENWATQKMLDAALFIQISYKSKCLFIKLFLVFFVWKRILCAFLINKQKSQPTNVGYGFFLYVKRSEGMVLSNGQLVSTYLYF